MGRFNDIFLSSLEKDSFSNFKDSTTDSRLSTLVLSRVFEFLAHLIPANISPNLVSVVGLLLTVHSYYLSFFYLEAFPKLVFAICIAFIVTQLVGDGVSAIHAKTSMQDTPLFDLFSTTCNIVGYVFSTLTGCLLLGITDHTTQWHLVHIGQMLSLTQHLGAFKRSNHSMRYPMFTGPGEVIFTIVCLIVASLFVDIKGFAIKYVHLAVSFCNENLGFSLPLDDYHLLAFACRTVYILLLVAVIFEVVFTLGKTNYASRNGLLLCLVYRGLVPMILYNSGFFGLGARVNIAQLAPLNIIADGLFHSVITVDMIVAKMSKRELHPWIVVFAMASVMSDFLTVLFMIVYYCALFFEISHYMELNMFAVTINVYVDGAYDMCHLGHINSFKTALGFGTRLFVGILSDESIAAYKRKPIMTLDERCAIVATSKYVHKVIRDSPGNGLDEQFIRKNKIHIVCHSWEYDKPDDHYYAVPRKMGITRVTPRTEGVSTSALIKRVGEYLTSGNAENKQEQQWKNEEEKKEKEKEKENANTQNVENGKKENDKVEPVEKKSLAKSKGRGKK
jgi:choline-phosphate cytidylyltransferase